MDDPCSDPRIIDDLDVIANHVYARLLTYARERGLGVLVVCLDNLPYQHVEKQFRRSCAQILVDLLDAAGVYLPAKRAS